MQIVGAQVAQGGEHFEHAVHVRDAFRVEFDGLVEGRCALCARRIASTHCRSLGAGGEGRSAP